MLADAVAYFLDFPFFFAPPAFLAAGFLGEDFLATTGFFFGEDFLAVTGGFLATFDFLAGTALLGDGAPRFPFLEIVVESVVKISKMAFPLHISPTDRDDRQKIGITDQNIVNF